jgi:pimeloyl-ACP methyl ester carboxylesterase
VDAGGNGRTGRFTSRYSQLTYPLYEHIRDQQQSFSSLAAWGPMRVDLSTSGESRPAQGMWVSGNFFSTLGVAPIAGRLIGPAEDRPDCPTPAAVISYPFWQREYAGRADIDRYLEHLAVMDPRIFLGMVAAAAEHDVEPDLPDIHVPTLVFASEKDLFTPLHRSLAMARRLPDAELLVLAEASHAAIIEHPAAINLRIERFLRERGIG